MKIRVDYKNLKNASKKVSQLKELNIKTKIKNIIANGDKVATVWSDKDNMGRLQIMKRKSSELDRIQQQLNYCYEILDKGYNLYSEALNKNIAMGKKLKQ